MHKASLPRPPEKAMPKRVPKRPGPVPKPPGQYLANLLAKPFAEGRPPANLLAHGPKPPGQYLVKPVPKPSEPRPPVGRPPANLIVKPVPRHLYAQAFRAQPPVPRPAVDESIAKPVPKPPCPPSRAQACRGQAARQAHRQTRAHTSRGQAARQPHRQARAHTSNGQAARQPHRQADLGRCILGSHATRNPAREEEAGLTMQAF